MKQVMKVQIEQGDTILAHSLTTLENGQERIKLYVTYEYFPMFLEVFLMEKAGYGLRVNPQIQKNTSNSSPCIGHESTKIQQESKKNCHFAHSQQNDNTS